MLKFKTEMKNDKGEAIQAPAPDIGTIIYLDRPEAGPRGAKTSASLPPVPMMVAGHGVDFQRGTIRLLLAPVIREPGPGVLTVKADAVRGPTKDMHFDYRNIVSAPCSEAHVRTVRLMVQQWASELKTNPIAQYPKYRERIDMKSPRVDQDVARVIGEANRIKKDAFVNKALPSHAHVDSTPMLAMQRLTRPATAVEPPRMGMRPRPH